MKIEISELYSKRFGVNIALDYGVTTETVEALQKECLAQDAALLITRCDTEDLETVHAFETAGFLLMDTLVYFRHDLNHDLPDERGAVRIRNCDLGDAEAVKGIAERVFANYGGHFHADRRLKTSDSDAVYSSWAYNSVVKREVADRVIGAELDGPLVGFLTLKSDGLVLEGLLIGVDEGYQNKGIAKALMAHALVMAKDQGFEVMVMSTQVQNIRSQRVWNGLGFKPFKSVYTFHKWFK